MDLVVEELISPKFVFHRYLPSSCFHCHFFHFQSTIDKEMDTMTMMNRALQKCGSDVDKA